MEGATRVLLLLLASTFSLAQDCQQGETYVRTGETREVANVQSDGKEASLNLFVLAERKGSFKGVRLDIENEAKTTAFFKTGGCFKRGDTRWKEVQVGATVDKEQDVTAFSVAVGSCAKTCAVDGVNTSLPFNLTVVAYGSSGWFKTLPDSCRVLYLSTTTPSPEKLPACLSPPPPPTDPSITVLICVATILCFLLVLFIVTALYCKYYASKK